MQNVLPQQAGLTIQNVIYKYSTEKNTEDTMLVHVQNEDAINGGYIFRHTDDWTGLPSNTIKKIVPASPLPIEYWGPGSIVVEGEGTVTEPSLVYTYKYDPCFDAQTDPSCPDYMPEYNLDDILPTVEDPLQAQYIQEELERQIALKEEEEYERKQRIKNNKVNIEKLLGGINMQAMSDHAFMQESAYFAINLFPASYYNPLEGNEYEDVLQLIDAELPDNKEGRRVNYTQQKLHNEMIQSQYDN